MKKIIDILFLVIVSISVYYSKYDIAIIIIGLYSILRDSTINEHFATNAASITSQYISGNATLNNLTITGNLTINGTTTTTGNITTSGSITSNSLNIKQTSSSNGTINLYGSGSSSPSIQFFNGTTNIATHTANSITINGTSEIAGSFSITSGGFGLSSGKNTYYMTVDSTGRLQLGPSPTTSLLSLPNSQHDHPVFRATGLMYTNFDQSDSAQVVDLQYKQYVYNAFKADNSYKQNLVYLGGAPSNATDSQCSNEIFIGLVRHNKCSGLNYWEASVPVLYDKSTICGSGTNCNWDTVSTTTGPGDVVATS